MEIWKDIEGFPCYQVSNLGRVRSFKRDRSGKIMKISPAGDGYLSIGITDKNGKCKYIAVHRLVATMFIQNPNNLPQVNHKNEVITDNRCENLEWCDRKYNMNYGTRTLRMKKSIAEYWKNHPLEGHKRAINAWKTKRNRS